MIVAQGNGLGVESGLWHLSLQVADGCTQLYRNDNGRDAVTIDDRWK